MLVVALAAGCGSGSAPSFLPADAPVRDLARRAAVYLGDDRFAAADIRRGEVLSLACQACHSLSRDRANPIGPNLDSVFGRPAAAQPGFAYSRALRESGIVWSAETLEAWLAAPGDFIEGTTMVFAGYGAETDRRDLIAYLAIATRPDTAD